MVYARSGLEKNTFKQEKKIIKLKSRRKKAYRYLVPSHEHTVPDTWYGYIAA